MMAPALMRSSKDGRRLPSSFQRSPAGITAIFRPYLRATEATAQAFLRHPARTVVGFAATVKVEPFGEGNTIRVPLGMAVNDVGDKEYMVGFRPGSANFAPTDTAKAMPGPSRQRTRQ